MMVHFPQLSDFQEKGAALVTTSCLVKHILRLGVRYAQTVFQNLLSVIRNRNTSRIKSLMPGTNKKAKRTDRIFWKSTGNPWTANYEKNLEIELSLKLNFNENIHLQKNEISSPLASCNIVSTVIFLHQFRMELFQKAVRCYLQRLQDNPRS